MNEKDKNGRFTKGNGNKGRPKGAKNKHHKNLTELLAKRLNSEVVGKDGVKHSYAEVVLASLDNLIFNPKTPPQVRLNAIRFMFERLEGLPTQVIRQDTANVSEAFSILQNLENEVVKLDIKVINSETNEETN